jgi:hypothetical protein
VIFWFLCQPFSWKTNKILLFSQPIAKSRGGMPFGEIYGSGKIILLDLLFSKGIKTFVTLKCKCGVSFKTYHGQVFVEMASAQIKR